MKKSPSKYYVYIYANDADGIFPPIHGKMDNEEYNSLDEAKQAIMKKDLGRFKEFEILTLTIKDQFSKLEDPKDCFHSIDIISLTKEQKEKLFLSKHLTKSSSKPSSQTKDNLWSR